MFYWVASNRLRETIWKYCLFPKNSSIPSPNNLICSLVCANRFEFICYSAWFSLYISAITLWIAYRCRFNTVYAAKFYHSLSSPLTHSISTLSSILTSSMRLKEKQLNPEQEERTRSNNKNAWELRLYLYCIRRIHSTVCFLFAYF